MATSASPTSTALASPTAAVTKESAAEESPQPEDILDAIASMLTDLSASIRGSRVDASAANDVADIAPISEVEVEPATVSSLNNIALRSRSDNDLVGL